MKAAIVLREDLGRGFQANAAACIATGLFADEEDVLGPEIEGADCTFISITKIGIPVLTPGHKNFAELLQRAKDNHLKYMLFTKEGQSTASYTEYIERVTGKAVAEVEIVGLGVIGEDELVTRFAGDLPLLK